MTPVTSGHPVPPDCSGTPCADGSASNGAESAESRLSFRSGAWGKGLALSIALWALGGCGGGLGFTGGSIPPGGTRLFGRVARAENPLQPLAQADVVVETRPVTGGVRSLHTVTASDGSFSFVSVPTGSTFATMTVTVTPDPLQGRQSQQVVFRADNGVADNLIVSLPLSSVDVTRAQSLKLRDITTLPPGDTTAIHALLFNAAGRRLSVQPTVLFTGNFGSIAIDETFSAALPGIGTITAFWYGLPSASTQIVVDSTAPQLPPAPPDLPPAADNLITDPIPLPVK